MKRVLIVDDEADVLWMLQKNLNKGMPDVEVLVAASGEEALHVLQSHSIDLVITDINMPGMNGLDLLVEINNKFPHIGVIIITAYPSNTYQSQAILSGSLKFIEKPFDIKYLRKVVEEFFNNERNGFQGTISGIDLIDIVQFNGLSRATSALKVTTGEITGMIFFKDGQVAHAICDQMSGEEAFFTILGFRGGNLKNIKGVETPVVTISKSLELLLLEATSSGDEILEKEEKPFLTYDDLENEPPPAFLSRQGKDEPRSLFEEESPAFLSDNTWPKAAVDNDLAATTVAKAAPETFPGMAPDAAKAAAVIPGLDVDDDDEHHGRAYFAKTSSILSAELRDQRAAALSAPVVPAVPIRDESDGQTDEPPLEPALDDFPPVLTDAEEDGPAVVTTPAARQAPTASSDFDADFLRDLMRDIPGLDVGGEESEEPAVVTFLPDDTPAFRSDAVPPKPPAKPAATAPAKPTAASPMKLTATLSTKPAAASPVKLTATLSAKPAAASPAKPTAASPAAPARKVATVATPAVTTARQPAPPIGARPAPKPTVMTDNNKPFAGLATAKDFALFDKTGKLAKTLSPLDSILAEFTDIDGVRLACLAGRDGFLIASQPAGDSAQAEALSAIASSSLISAESMGEDLSRGTLQAGLFEYQDGMMILSPLGQDSFLILVAEERTNLGWLRLAIRKNAPRMEELNAL